jgi:hypothetical protein
MFLRRLHLPRLERSWRLPRRPSSCWRSAQQARGRRTGGPASFFITSVGKGDGASTAHCRSRYLLRADGPGWWAGHAARNPDVARVLANRQPRRSAGCDARTVSVRVRGSTHVVSSLRTTWSISTETCNAIATASTRRSR